MSQSVGDTTRKRTRTDSAFFSAISSAHDSAQSLLRICANEIEKLLKKDIVSNFGRCAFLRNIDQPCIELILSSCDAKQLQEIERIHEEDGMKLNTEKLWENLYKKQWKKCHKPVHLSWKEHYLEEMKRKEEKDKRTEEIVLKAKNMTSNNKKQTIKALDEIEIKGRSRQLSAENVISKRSKEKTGTEKRPAIIEKIFKEMHCSSSDSAPKSTFKKVIKPTAKPVLSAPKTKPQPIVLQRPYTPSLPIQINLVKQKVSSPTDDLSPRTPIDADKYLALKKNKRSINSSTSDQEKPSKKARTDVLKDVPKPKISSLKDSEIGQIKIPKKKQQPSAN